MLTNNHLQHGSDPVIGGLGSRFRSSTDILEEISSNKLNYFVQHIPIGRVISFDHPFTEMDFPCLVIRHSPLEYYWGGMIAPLGSRIFSDSLIIAPCISSIIWTWTWISLRWRTLFWMKGNSSGTIFAYSTNHFALFQTQFFKSKLPKWLGNSWWCLCVK